MEKNIDNMKQKLHNWLIPPVFLFQIPINTTNAQPLGSQLVAFTSRAAYFTDVMDVIFVTHLVERLTRLVDKKKDVRVKADPLEASKNDSFFTFLFQGQKIQILIMILLKEKLSYSRVQVPSICCERSETRENPKSCFCSIKASLHDTANMSCKKTSDMWFITRSSKL